MTRNVFVTLALFVIAVSCQSPVVETGSLVLSVNTEMSGRLIGPDFDLEPASYVVTGKGPRNASFEITTSSPAAEKTGLVFGVWEIRAYARNAAGIVIAEGRASAIIHVGSVTETTVIVTPLSGTGSLELSVTWNGADTEYPSIDSELVPVSLPAMDLAFAVSGGNSATYAGIGIPTGYHTLVVKLMDGPSGNKTVAMGAVEVVRIVKDRTSRGSFVFDEINCQAGKIRISIDADMQNPIDVLVSGVADNGYEGSGFTAVASAPGESGNIVYVWYLNGTSVGTGASYTAADLDAGVYSLDVTAFTADGKRAGSSHAKFHVLSFDRTRVSDFAWSPDGTKIAFVKSESGNYWNNDLWVADKTMRNPRIIAHGLSAGGIADWQGDSILFTKDYEAGDPPAYNGSGDYFSVRPDGTQEKQITFTYTNGIRTNFGTGYYINIGTAVWAKFVKNTNLVYFHAHNGNGWYRTFVCSADGTDGWRDVSSPDYTWRADVSPAGNKLFFASSSNYNQPMTIKSVNPDGSGKTVIKGPLQQCHFISLSTGNALAWNIGNAIFAINSDGSGERTVMNDAYENVLAGCGTTGSSILVLSDRADGNRHVYNVDIASGIPVQVSFGDYDEFSPAYSPDYSSIAYLRLPADYSGSGMAPYELVIKPVE